jgi:U4/U6.U5 tri-snRNP-associated protein 2
VYACLVCGNYFQGRGQRSHAYFHSLELNHHVFIHLQNRRVYCLPDGYEVHDASLHDIQYNLNPTFTMDRIRQVDAQHTYSHVVDGADFLPGTMGLNNIKKTGWFNCVMQTLTHIPLLRNFFLLDRHEAAKNGKPSQLVYHFGLLTKKMWNPMSFKGHVSPHEMLQAVSSRSDKKFRIGEQSDPIRFISWLLNTMHRDLGGTRKPRSSVVQHALQGELRMISRKPKPRDKRSAAADAQIASVAAPPSTGAAHTRTSVSSSKGSKADNKDKDRGADESDSKIEYDTYSRLVPFLYLSLQLPSDPLFKDTDDRFFIPQVSLLELLKKFDGKTEELQADGTRVCYQITRLPRYLAIHIRRFGHNNWFMEKNRRLVNFPLENLDLTPYLEPCQTASTEELMQQSLRELNKMAKIRKVDTKGCVEKRDLAARLVQHAEKRRPKSTRYNLVANIVHEGKPDDGVYKSHVLHKGTSTWYEIQDLHVRTSDTMAAQVALSESYIQLYELQRE